MQTQGAGGQQNEQGRGSTAGAPWPRHPATRPSSLLPKPCASGVLQCQKSEIQVGLKNTAKLNLKNHRALEGMSSASVAVRGPLDKIVWEGSKP